MLSLSYIQNILSGIMPPTNIIESDAGYDAIIELIQTKGLERVIIFDPLQGYEIVKSTLIDRLQG